MQKRIRLRDFVIGVAWGAGIYILVFVTLALIVGEAPLYLHAIAGMACGAVSALILEKRRRRTQGEL